MTLRYFAFLCVCLFVIGLGAAVVAPKQLVILGGYKSGLGCYEQMTSLSSVSHPTVPTDAYLAHFQVETQNVRWRDDYSVGSLTTRTTDSNGVCTQAAGHGIQTGDTVSVWWDGGERHSMDATVSGNAVTVDGGSGDNLPAADTVTEVGTDPTTSVGMQLVAGEWLDNYDCELLRIRFIEETASAKINCSYRKP